MHTTPATLKPAPMHRTGAALAAAGALIAVGIVALFLALAGSGVNHAVIRHPVQTYYPLIQYHGTGQPPVTARQTTSTNTASTSSRPGYRNGAHS
jgi:hypothetical protein